MLLWRHSYQHAFWRNTGTIIYLGLSLGWLLLLSFSFSVFSCWECTPISSCCCQFKCCWAMAGDGIAMETGIDKPGPELSNNPHQNLARTHLWNRMWWETGADELPGAVPEAARGTGGGETAENSAVGWAVGKTDMLWDGKNIAVPVVTINWSKHTMRHSSWKKRGEIIAHT